MDVKKITVCGGGNGAQTLLGVAVQNLGCAVDVYAPFGDEAALLNAGIVAHDGLELSGTIRTRAHPRRISADPAEVIPGSEVVILVLPAFAHESTLRQIVPHLEPNAWVGVMPARGGFDFCADAILRELGRVDVRLFGLQTLSWACRIRKYGRIIDVLGVKQVIDAAVRPQRDGRAMRKWLSELLAIPVEDADGFLALTLANPGQLIHPGIMYALFGEWDGTPFSADAIPDFYHSLRQERAYILAGLSDDVQAIRARLAPAIDLSAVHPLKTWLLRSYADVIADPSNLWSAFTTNRAYAGIKAPVRAVAPGQFVPDFSARYLAEDVPFGLAVTRAIAELVDVPVPMIDEVMDWAGERLGKDYLGGDRLEARIPQKYGITSLEQLLAAN